MIGTGLLYLNLLYYLCLISLGDTYVDVSPFDFVKIFIIYLFIIIYLLFIIILPRICSQDISRLNKAIIMKLAMMIDLSLT